MCFISPTHSRKLLWIARQGVDGTVWWAVSNAYSSNAYSSNVWALWDGFVNCACSCSLGNEPPVCLQCLQCAHVVFLTLWMFECLRFELPEWPELPAATSRPILPGHCLNFWKFLKNFEQSSCKMQIVCTGANEFCSILVLKSQICAHCKGKDLLALVHELIKAPDNQPDAAAGLIISQIISCIKH